MTWLILWCSQRPQSLVLLFSKQFLVAWWKPSIVLGTRDSELMESPWFTWEGKSANRMLQSSVSRCNRKIYPVPWGARQERFVHGSTEKWQLNSLLKDWWRLAKKRLVWGETEESVKSKCIEMWENRGALGEERLVVHIFLSVMCGPWASDLCPQTSYWYRSWSSEGADESKFTILGGVGGCDDSVSVETRSRQDFSICDDRWFGLELGESYGAAEAWLHLRVIRRKIWLLSDWLVLERGLGHLLGFPALAIKHVIRRQR